MSERSHIRLHHAFEIVALLSKLEEQAHRAIEKSARSLYIRAAVAKSCNLLGLKSPFAEAAIETASATIGPPQEASPDNYGGYLPTPPVVVDRMLMLANVQSDDTVVDLGCGDGRIVIEAARQHGARGIGVDIDPALIAGARESAAGLNVNFIEGDALSVDVSEASVVCLFLTESAFPRIREQIVKHLRPGTRIVSHHFAFTDWPPKKVEVVDVRPDRATLLFLWEVPQKVEDLSCRPRDPSRQVSL